MGEAGIGKTRLAEELALHAVRRGMTALWGRCWEGGGAPAYWPWAQIVSGLLELPGSLDRLTEMGPAAAYVDQLLPEPRAELAAAPLGSPPSADARFEMLGALAAFLGSVAASSPLLLILDDLHADDGPSLVLLRFVARQIRSARIFLVGTFRPGAAHQRPETTRLLAELTGEARTLPLAGLDREQVGRLMARTSGVKLPARLVSAVHGITEGNPLFVDELTRWLAAEGRLDAEAVAAGEIQLPAGVRQAIRARIRPLDGEIQAALSVAAAIGREFDLVLLQRAAGLRAEVAIERLGEAVAAGVLRELPGRIGTYGFTHALVRETLYAEIEPHRRARIHGRIGAALEALHASRLDEHVSELAFHYCEASVAGEATKAVGYALRAGERALAMFAYEEAAAHFERGLEALELGAASGDEGLAESLLDLGSEQGLVPADDPIEDEGLRPAMLARRLRALALLARAALAYGGFAIDEYAPEGKSASLLEEALASLDAQDGALRARILARLQRLRILASPWQERVALSREAVAAARSAADRTALAYALDAFELSSWADGPTPERLAAADELTHLAQESRDGELEVHARLWRIGLLVDQGDLVAADREIAAHAQSASRLGHPQLTWTVAVLEGMRASVAGRFAESERHFQSAVAIAQRARIRPAARILAMQFLMLRRECGGLEQVEAAVREAAERHPPASVYRSVLALVCAELGRTAEASSLFEALSSNGFADLTRDSSWPVSVACLAEVCASLADRERASSLYAELLPRDGTNLGLIVACLGPAAHYLGLLAATKGRYDDAERHFESALRASRAMKAEPFEARTEAAYASMLAARDAPGDAAAARERSRRALEIGRRLGMASLVARLASDASALAARVAPPLSNFVGRTQELAELATALRTARSGQGGLVLLSGEPGVGKTRLMSELASVARSEGAKVLRSASRESLGVPAYHLWTGVVRECLAEGGGPERTELRDLVPATASPALLDSEEARFRLFESVAGVLRDRAARDPLLVLLDDLQWADESSLLLLGFLARDFAHARILLVGAYRDVEARLSAEVGRRITDLACDARTIRLEGLAEAEVAAFVERETGEPAAAVAGAVRRATGGNPLFVEEVVRTLVSEGNIAAGLSVATPLPDRVRAVIGRRTKLVSEACRRMLSVASVLGKDLDVAMLEQVCTALGEFSPQTMEEACAARILVPSQGGFSFAHDLFRETLYDDLGTAERCRYHEAAGETLERLHSSELDLWLPELARHFLLAGRAQAERAVRYSLRAAERASRSFAHVEAVAHYRRALEAHATSGASGSESRCRILLALGESLWSTGEFEEARRVYEQAAELAETLGLDAELARAALGFGGQDVSFDGGIVEPRLIRLLETGLRRIGEDDGVLRASLLARLAAALAFSDERDRGARLAADAVEIARRLDDEPTLHLALNCFIAATWGPDDLEQRLAVSREATRLAAKLGGARMAEMHGALMTALLERGDAAAAEREAEAYRQRTALAGRHVSTWFLAVRRTMIALLEGRFAEVEALAAHALELGSGGRSQNAAQYFGAQILVLRREQGRLDEMVGAVEQFIAAYPAVPAWRATLVWVYAELGRDDEARLALERLAAADFADVPRDMFWLLCLWLLADAVARLGDVRRAGILYRLLLPYRARCVTSGAAFCGGSLERSLGVLATTLGRYDDAATHFDAARAVNERIGARPWVAHGEYDHARMLLARAAPADHASAVERLRRSAASARALGMPSLLARAQRLLAESHTPAAREAGDEAALRCEGDYWTLTYGGSSAQIRDARGLRLIALLLASPGREFRAIDLAGWPAAPLPSGTVTGAVARAEGLATVDLAAGGVEGPDARAMAEYRARLARLREEIEEAEAFNDPLRAASAREELDRLSDEVVSAARSGSRRASQDAERARLSVTKAIRYALRKVEHAHPSLGRLLAATVKTGTSCRYEPDPHVPIRWRL